VHLQLQIRLHRVGVNPFIETTPLSTPAAVDPTPFAMTVSELNPGGGTDHTTLKQRKSAEATRPKRSTQVNPSSLSSEWASREGL
jgi:hypothetical protein